MASYGIASSGSQHSSPDAPKSFIEKIKSTKGPVVGTVLTMPSVIIAQLAGQADCDFVMIDMEHAPLPMEVVTQMVHAYVQVSRGTRFPIVRIPSHGVEWVKWALDSGAAGIIIPMVNNAREMKAILERAVYPPAGQRSFGPLYAPFGHPDGPHGGMGGYFERAKRGDIAILPIIESREGLDNVEEILGLEGVAGCFIGPADLRLSLGLTAGVDGPEPEFLNALKRICEVGKKLGKVVGCMGLGEGHAGKRTAEGMDFLMSAFDYGAVVSGLANDLAAARKGVQSGLAKL
ncbi:hypothetical protein LTR10_023041 [Elasticomyces elasticus]|uniref:HpcH/HpaI aldolase/citrate lyase domain-containing protein n=1 Tax=Exophiala sideris TaxID=1016849 RepID=A0ABR0IUL8_9EURO|nr:hypothetical protein LTR10_023041 [Elasticomyces elasticus]KAK5021037.1 hypothetical protein LTS07_011292 [Exophiala sideris]KAK5023322.1 hypothetical protein LTR13_011234 [Exophiala sideris]KAK5048763.1 hypothetical protein LTR69_011309 [Exophiala sideris]KAK5176173.1 hypothetical protein LTR44_011268 [Eurotiomycetes sp. CCFEE 6388]